MERMLIVILAVILICCSSISYAYTPDNNGSMQINDVDYNKLFKNDIEQLINRQMKAYNWKLVNLNYKQISSNKENDKVEVTRLIELNHRLNYDKPESVPALKGKIHAFNELKNEATAINAKLVEKDIDLWISNLQDYINNDQYMSEVIKITAQIDDKNNAIPGSINKFIQDYDKFVPARRIYSK